MVVSQQEYDLILGTSVVIDQSHATAFAAFSSGYPPAKLPTSRSTNNNVTGCRAYQQVLLQPSIILILEEAADQFSEYRRLNEGEFHDRILRQ